MVFLSRSMPFWWAVWNTDCPVCNSGVEGRCRMGRTYRNDMFHRARLTIARHDFGQDYGWPSKPDDGGT